METIKSYLESMFATLPNTAEVNRAKNELLQMMEDKYNELIAEGRSENEAIGTVISEFGNLDEIADDFGIKGSVEKSRSEAKKYVSLERATEYIKSAEKAALIGAIGVAFFILSITGPIICSDGTVGAAVMFALIGAGVALCIISAQLTKGFSDIRKNTSIISYETARNVKREEVRNRLVTQVCRTVGIIFICLSWWGEAFFEKISFVVGLVDGAVFFFAIGIGVGLLVYAGRKENAYKKVLSLNDSGTVGGAYFEKEEDMITNPTIKTILSVFWPTVACVYVSVSFLTNAWHLTWLIWPLAAIADIVIRNIGIKKEERN